MENNIMSIASYLYHNGTKDKLKLQKLLYISFGFYGALNNGEHLFTNPIEAWQYGPVIPEVYHNYNNLEKTPYGTDTISKKQKKTLDRVINLYAHKDPFYLVGLTHQEKSPWSNTKSKQEIDKEEIISHYKFLLGVAMKLSFGDSRKIMEDFARR